jgi:hypothetical protein
VPQLHDVDLTWCSAARHAFGAHERTLACFRVVTRTGWVDVISGERRTWARLRL